MKCPALTGWSSLDHPALFVQMLALENNPWFDFEWYDRLWTLMIANVIGGTTAVSASIMSLGTFINHSCEPNCHPCVGVGHAVTFKAQRDIKKGEQLLSFYTDLERPVEERRGALEEQYLFTCKCPRCLREAGEE